MQTRNNFQNYIQKFYLCDKKNDKNLIKIYKLLAVKNLANRLRRSFSICFRILFHVSYLSRLLTLESLRAKIYLMYEQFALLAYSRTNNADVTIAKRIACSNDV